MRVRDGNTVVKEQIKTNIAENTTEVDTVDDRGQDAIIYNDFKKVTLKVIIIYHAVINRRPKGLMLTNEMSLRNHMSIFNFDYFHSFDKVACS